MNPETKIIHQRMNVLELAETLGNASEACRQRGASRTPFYEYKRRFQTQGLAGLQDEARPGRRPAHTPETRRSLVSLAAQNPATLGYPSQLWTLERLQRAFAERHGTHLSDSTIWDWLAAEGLEWKRQQSWFHETEKHDSQFV